MDDLEDQVSQGFSSLVSTAAPTVIAGAENYAAQQLSASASTAQAQATAAAAKAPAATGILASIENSFGQSQIGAFLQKNYLYVLGGVAVLGIGGYFMFRKSA